MKKLALFFLLALFIPSVSFSMENKSVEVPVQNTAETSQEQQPILYSRVTILVEQSEMPPVPRAEPPITDNEERCLEGITGCGFVCCLMLPTSAWFLIP